MFVANEHQDQLKSQENHDQRKIPTNPGDTLQRQHKTQNIFTKKDERACSKRDKGKL